MRHIARTDSNQAEIVAALRRIGCSVQTLHQVGSGVPDLLVGFRGVNLLFEVKADRGRLTPAESTWLDEWRGTADVIRNAEEALALIEALTV